MTAKKNISIIIGIVVLLLVQDLAHAQSAERYYGYTYITTHTSYNLYRDDLQPKEYIAFITPIFTGESSEIVHQKIEAFIEEKGLKDKVIAAKGANDRIGETWAVWSFGIDTDREKVVSWRSDTIKEYREEKEEDYKVTVFD